MCKVKFYECSDANGVCLAGQCKMRASFSLHAQGGHDVFAHELPLPPLPPRAAYAPTGAPPQPPRAPALDDGALAGLAPKQAARLRSEHSAASELDEQLRQARAATGSCGVSGRAAGVGTGFCAMDMLETVVKLLLKAHAACMAVEAQQSVTVPGWSAGAGGRAGRAAAGGCVPRGAAGPDAVQEPHQRRAAAGAHSQEPGHAPRCAEAIEALVCAREGRHRP